ncbi:MAG: hypothetical protein MnENMB40S_02460 [Rhizobiaceae bacterium MnEN-MB40S]|nr:MAG: hypothetical protein MnENMB40S_02460 [Rhizobiaceae bacterium MnEN-MB40S]
MRLDNQNRKQKKILTSDSTETPALSNFFYRTIKLHMHGCPNISCETNTIDIDMDTPPPVRVIASFAMVA